MSQDTPRKDASSKKGNLVIESVEERESRIVTIKLTKQVEQRRQALLENHKCLACEKQLGEGENVRCGQCDACYSALRRAIDKRLTTRISAIRAGELLPPTKGGRKPSNPYTKRLSGR